LKALKESAVDEGYYDAVKEQYEALKAAIMHSKEEDLLTYRNEISEILKMEIVTRYYYQEGKIRASLSSDPDINRAIRILEEPATYQSILEGTYSEENASGKVLKENGKG